MRDLASRLNAIRDEQPYTTTWYLEDLTTGETADRDGSRVVPSASTRKIAIMMTALEAVNAGRRSLDEPFTIDARYQDNDSGVFQHLTPGFAITFRDALAMMIIVSDNTCTGKIVNLLGLDAINAYSQRVSMVGTTHRFNIPPKVGRDHTLEQANTTTAADVGRLLGLILQGTTDKAVASSLGVTPKLCSLALDILLWQKLNNRLPALLPTAARVAHKTGTGVEKRNNNDAGIIFQGDTPLCVLSIYTEHLPVDMPDGTSGFNAASLTIARMAKTCYDTLASGAASAATAQGAAV